MACSVSQFSCPHPHSIFHIGGRVDVGAAFLIQDGCLVESTRTLARAEGIEKFLATHSYADSVDLRTFLDGFDAGEEYCKAALSHEPDIRERQQTHATTYPKGCP